MMFRLLLLFISIQSLAALQCWTCDTKCGCKNPVAEQCPASTKCYTLKSLTHGDIVRKGCARDCINMNQNDKFCESCDNDRCNSEQSLTPMNSGDFDECRDTLRLEPLAYNSNGIGQGTYGGGNNPSIGSGTGYNGGIGQGTGYNGGGIGSGTGYNNPNYNDGQVPRQRPNGYGSGIGSGTGYNPNPIGSGTGGNYNPSINVNDPQYPYGRYGGNSNIGQGAYPYNSASKHFFHVIPISICLLLAQLF